MSASRSSDADLEASGGGARQADATDKDEDRLRPGASTATWASVPLWLWFSLVAQVPVCVVGGVLYDFGLFSTQIGALIDATNREMNQVFAFTYFAATFLVAPVGLIINFFGASRSMIAIISVGVVGWVVLYGMVDGWIDGARNTTVTTIIFLIIGWSIGAASNGAFVSVTLSKIAPWEWLYPYFLGSLAISLGLGGVVFTEVFEGMDRDLPSFFLVVMCIFAAAGVLSSVGLFVFDANCTKPRAPESQPLLVNESADAPAPQGTELSFWAVERDLACSPTFWMLWFVALVSSGIGSAMGANTGALSLRTGGGADETAELDNAYSGGQTGGRILLALLLPLALTRFSHRPFALLALLGTFMIIGSIILVTRSPDHLDAAVGVAFIAAGYGGMWSTIPALSSNLKHASTHFGYVWGSILLAAGSGPFLVGELVGHNLDQTTDCAGDDCFTSSAYYFLGAAILECVLILVLFVRTK